MSAARITPSAESRGLDPAADHTRHGQVEALPQPIGPADDIGIGHEEVLQSQIERVHAVADGRNGASGENASLFLGK